MTDTAIELATFTFSGQAMGSTYYDLELQGTCDVTSAPALYIPGHMNVRGPVASQPRYQIRPLTPGHVLVQVGNAANYPTSYRRFSVASLGIVIEGHVIVLPIMPVLIIPGVVNMTSGIVLDEIP